jgi:hypothetical protein
MLNKYQYQNPFLTMEEECRLTMFKNRVPRNIFCPERDEVTGDWSKLHNEELNDLYFIPSIIQVIKSRMRMAWLVTYWGEDCLCGGVLRGGGSVNP